jgi:ABC-type amino acid transport system permease subunit
VRQQPQLVVLLVLLALGLAIFIAYIGREPSKAVIWLTLAWLVGLALAMGAYARSTRRDG